MWRILTLSFLALEMLSRADLLVKVELPNVTGQMAVVKINMRNTFNSNVTAARAAVFLTDQQGSVVGHVAKWVIAGQKYLPALPPGGTNQFNFAVPLSRQVAGTNLTAKVQFDRVVLENGRMANIPETVRIEQEGK